MRTFASVALLTTLVFIAAEARPSEDDLIVKFAIGGSESYSWLAVARTMENYGRKLALVGRLISKVGDSITGLARWIRKRNGSGTDIGVRPALVMMSRDLSEQESNSSEAYIAAKILAGTFKRVAENESITDSQLEPYLDRCLASISQKLISASRGAELDAEKLDDAVADFFERFASDF